MNFELKRLVLDSREVAEMLGKNHADLLRDIARNIAYLIESNFAFNDFFQENQYKDKIGRTLKKYDITKKGCEFLAHKLTGKKGAIFTASYINKFYEMEQALRNNEAPKLPLKHIEIVDKIPREELISMRRMIDMLTQEIEKDVKEIKNILGRIEDHKTHINVYSSVLRRI